MQQWAEREGVVFLDLATPFATATRTDALFFTRDIHFTDTGHRIVADTILDAYPEAFE